MRAFPPLGQDKRVLVLTLPSIAYRRAYRRRRAASHISIFYVLLSHCRTLRHDDFLLLANSRGRGGLAPLGSVLDVSGVAVDDDVLGFGYPSSEGCPIGSATMSRPCARDGVNAFAEGEEGDGKAVDENRTEDDKSDDRLNGFCQKFRLGLRISLRVRQLVNGEGGDEYSA